MQLQTEQTSYYREIKRNYAEIIRIIQEIKNEGLAPLPSIQQHEECEPN